MDLQIGIRVLEAALFGLVFAALYYLIVGWTSWRSWLGMAVVLAGLADIILFGAIRV